MPLTCNIDARGKRYRLIMGIGLLVVGLALAIGAARTGGTVLWIVAAAVLISGAFGIFEARAGWCAMRAMGFKTKI